MSLFDLFKKKTPTVTPTPEDAPTPEPLTWENTPDPDVFFTGYQDAVETLTTAGQHAAAETLRANEPALQLAFIDRFEAKTRTDIANISDLDERTDAVIAAVSTVRRYNRQMSVAVRARLAQAKKNLIGE